MADPKMHPDEVDTDAGLVARMLAAQFPQWAHLPIRRVASTGTDNAMFRVGTRLRAAAADRVGGRLATAGAAMAAGAGAVAAAGGAGPGGGGGTD
ncbi:hypothetical protein ACFQ9X_19875 [Catenulispora yoronensis]